MLKTFSLPVRWLTAGMAVWLAACQPSADSTAKKPAAKTAEKIPVSVGTVQRKTVPLRMESIGNVEPYATVSVKSRVEGQLMSMAFREGDNVSQGQLLFEVDSRPVQAQIRQLKANLVRDRAQWENAKATLQRYEGLQGKNFVSAEMLHRARTDVAVFAANIESDEALLQSAQLQLDYASIRSPLNGRTGKLMVYPGNQVKADSVLVVINQIEPVRVSFAVPEHYLPALREHAKSGALTVRVKLEGAAGTAMPTGKLSFIDNTVDTATGTIKLKAVFDNKDQRLWAGQFVRVWLDLQEQAGALTIPAQAVLTGPAGNYVFAVKPDGKVARRDIVLERIQDEDAVVASGLAAGETVVVDGQSRLTDGAAADMKAKPDGQPPR